MASKLSKILADNKNYKNSQVISQNISKLWNAYKKLKSKFYAHNVKLEQFTLKVLKLSFFNNPQLKKCSNKQKSKYLKIRKINAKRQLVLIKKAISIHLRSLKIEQRLFEENQFLKELLNSSYKIVIKEKYSPAIEIIEIKNANMEEKCFKSGLEYIFHELEDVLNQTKLKTKRILGTGIDNIPIPLEYINEDTVAENLKCPPLSHQENTTKTGLNAGKPLQVILEVADLIEIDTEESLAPKFDLQIDLKPSNSHFQLSDITQTVNNNLQSIFEYVANHSLNKLVIDAEPACIETVLDIKDTVDIKRLVQKKEVPSAKVRSIENESIIGIDMRENIDKKSLKNISTFIPKNFIQNYIGLFFPLPFLFGKDIRCHRTAARKKCGNLILQKEVACVDLQRTSNDIEFKDKNAALENVSSTCTGWDEGKNFAKLEPDECLNLSEIKTVEFYDIPSDTDSHDYTVSWVEQQNERDFYYIKPEKIDNYAETNGQPKKRKSIMKRSAYSAHQDFKDYLKNIISYSEEFYNKNKRNSNSTIIPPAGKKRKIINFPSHFTESKFAGKYKTKNILEHNKDYNNYKLSKMPDMNKTYQIVFQENKPQGFSLKFVKSTEKNVSTLIVSNRYPTNKPNFPKTRLYKKII